MEMDELTEKSWLIDILVRICQKENLRKVIVRLPGQENQTEGITIDEIYSITLENPMKYCKALVPFGKTGSNKLWFCSDEGYKKIWCRDQEGVFFMKNHFSTSFKSKFSSLELESLQLEWERKALSQ